MPRRPSPLVLAAFVLAAVLGLPAAASAQISWSVTYLDAGTGQGFDDPRIPNGETLSLGQLRQNSMTAAFGYLNTVLDGRGTVNVTVQPSNFNAADPTLAFFGTTYPLINGSFQNGQAYQAARTNQRPFDPPDSDGQFNFGHAYNYAGQKSGASSSAYDMVTVAVHELTHGNGFANLVNQVGQGANGQPVGSPDTYSTYDSYLQRGSGSAATPLFNTNINSSNYGSFTGNTSTFTNGNDANTGLFFGGKYAKEVFNGAVPLFAPNPYQPGSSVAHDNTVPEGVMNWSITPNTVRRLQPYEIAMLLDLGWNVYNWNGSGGNWLDGVNDLTASHWQTDKGIVLSGDQQTTYNLNATPGQAPILPPYAQVTSNIVLNFGGSGSTGYTSTNDIGTVRLARLNLNSTSTGTNTITGGTLLFGQNSDGTSSVLVPKIVQQNSGGFTIASAVQIPVGLTVDGTGTGRVTLSGAISGAGGLTKAGGFTLALTGNNTYSGGTTVTAGTVLVNGQTGTNSGTGSGAVSVTGGTLGGTGRIGGSLSATGGTVQPGDTTPGILTVGGGMTFNSSATFAARLNGTTAGTGYDQLRVESGNVTLGSAALSLSLGYTPALGDRLVIIRNDGTGTTSGQFAGFNPGSPVNVGGTTVYAYYNFDLASGTFGGGNDVVITFAPVPEPAGVLLVGGAGLGLFALVRRRRVRVGAPAPAVSEWPVPTLSP